MRAALALWGAILLGPCAASACDCGTPPGLTGDALTKWRFETAKIVVRGQVVEFRAGRHVSKDWPVLARVKVKSVVKGDFSKREFTVVTSDSSEGCGLGRALYNAVTKEAEVSMTLDPRPLRHNGYFISSCQFFETHPN